MERTLEICFEDMGQLKEDLAEYLRSWQSVVSVGDTLLLKVVRMPLGRTKNFQISGCDNER